MCFRRILNWVEERKRRMIALKHKKSERSRNKTYSDIEYYSSKSKTKSQNQIDKRKQVKSVFLVLIHFYITIRLTYAFCFLAGSSAAGLSNRSF